MAYFIIELFCVVMVLILAFGFRSRSDDAAISRSDFNVTKSAPNFKTYKNFHHTRHRRRRKRLYRGRPVMPEEGAAEE